MSALRPGVGSLIGGLTSAIAGSVCCVGPLVLVSLGISGVWIANLRVLEPYDPIFMGLTAVFLWLAYRKIYGTAKVCAPEAACAVSGTQRMIRMAFWLVTLFALVTFALPYFAKFFY